MRHEKTVSVSKIRHLWEPWEEDETPRNVSPLSCFCVYAVLANIEWEMEM